VRPEEAVAAQLDGAVVVLLVDDEAPVRRAITRLLQRFGYEVVQAEDGARALQMLNDDHRIKVVLLDQAMPSGSGASFAPRLRALKPHVPLIFHTGQQVAPEHRALVDDVLLKPASPEALVAMLDRWAKR
jgi:CheY-like chemotaxis protein